VITLFAPDGVTRIAEQDINFDVFPNAGIGGNFDLDFDCVRLDAAGTYFVRVAQDIPANGGASYAVAVSGVNPAGVQLETEVEGATGSNETPAAPQALAIGVMQGSVIAPPDIDTYAFQVVQVPAIVQAQIKGWRLGGSGAAALDVRAMRLKLIATDMVTELGNLFDGYSQDPFMSVAITSPGTYYFTVEARTATSFGRYQLHYDLRSVGAINEVENNDSSATANALQEGQFINATTGPGDLDHFSFSAVAGEMRSIRVWANANHDTGTTQVTTTILAPGGLLVVPSTTSAGPFAHFRERRFIAQETGTYYVRVTPDAPAASPYIIRNVRAMAGTYENEPNDVMGGANAFNAAGRAAGVIPANGDVDWFGFSAAAGELVTIKCFARATGPAFLDFLRNWHGSFLQPVLTAIDSGGATLATSTHTPASGRKAHGMSGRGATVEVSFRAPAAGSYFVRVGEELGIGATNRYYLLERR
jgi:hypothetical protein